MWFCEVNSVNWVPCAQHEWEWKMGGGSRWGKGQIGKDNKSKIEKNRKISTIKFEINISDAPWENFSCKTSSQLKYIMFKKKTWNKDAHSLVTSRCHQKTIFFTFLCFFSWSGLCSFQFVSWINHYFGS